MKVFDTHAHYLDNAFNADRDTVLDKLFSSSVGGIIEAATTVSSSYAALALAERYPRLWAAVGIHPEEAAHSTDNDLSVLKKLASHPKAVAIGEIGLDYHYEDLCPREIQKHWFTTQLQLANDLSLPVVVHDREAHEDTLSLLKKYHPRGVIHCFSGSEEMMKEIIRLGMYIGIGGVLTFKNARKAVEVASAVPADRFLLETDAPYLAPVPYRGHRCDSSMIVQTAAVLASLRSLSTDEVLQQAAENAQHLYSL